MAKFKPHPDDKIIEKQQKSNTGIYISAGDIEHSDYDDKDWSDLQKDYTHMRDGHALISTTIDILKFPILMSEYRMESKNKEAEDYMYWVFNNLEKGFEYFKRHKLLALDFGLSMHEMVIKRGDKFNGKLTNRPIWFSPIQNETINKFFYDDQTRFTGIEHEKRTPEKHSSFIDIEKEYLEYYTYNEEYNDIKGRALLRPVRLLWESEVNILKARVTSIQRGAGIPIIYTHGEPSSADEAKIEKIGRTICQLRNGYASANKEKIEIDLLEPKGQQDAMQMLEWIDRQIFFNTLSQFMTAGIGGNGSRAATSEHKSSYELVANYILQSLEDNFQQLTDRIMKMSYLAKIPQVEYPQFHSNAINQIDLSKVAQNIKTLFDSSAVTKQKEDEVYFREIFGMPELNITTEIASPQKAPTSIFSNKKKLKKNVRTITTEKLEFEDRVFSLESANDHYETIETQINNLLDKKYHSLFEDIISQLEKNRLKNIIIKNSLIEESIDELMQLYKIGYSKGERDIKIEVKKIGGKEDTNKLTLDEKSFEKKRSIISKLIKKLFMNTKISVENKMSVVTNKFVQLKGGLSNYMLEFEAGFKNDKNNIKKNIEASYIDGRGETLMDMKDEIKTFFYSARMDTNLCDNCAPFDGQIMTYNEIGESGLSFLSPVNSFCLGGSNCRCVILPYEYGRQ